MSTQHQQGWRGASTDAEHVGVTTIISHGSSHSSESVAGDPKDATKVPLWRLERLS